MGLVLSLSLTLTPSFAALKAGSTCTQAGKTAVSAGIQFKCVKQKKKLVWQRIGPVKPSSPTPSPTPTPTPVETLSPSPTPTPTPAPTSSATMAPAPINSVAKCKIPVFDGRGDVAIGFPRISDRLKSTGSVTIQVIFVDFPDAPATMTTRDAFAKVSEASKLFDELSYGRLQFVMQPNHKWYRMSQSAKSYAPLNQSFMHHRAYIAEATALADSEVDFSRTDGILILANPDAQALGNSGPAFSATFGNGITLDGKYIANGATSAYDLNYWSYIWLNHEFGHAMGLVDLYAFRPEDSTNPNDYHRFVGEYSLMGLSSLKANSPGYLAWERWLLGWIDDEQILCLQEKSTTTLVTPVQRKSGLKAIVVPLSMTRVLVVESRRAEGVDKNLTKPGALVYVVDSAVQSGLGPVKVIPIEPADNRRLKSTRAQGESVTFEGVTITVKKSDADGDLIEVVRN